MLQISSALVHSLCRVYTPAWSLLQPNSCRFFSRHPRQRAPQTNRYTTASTTAATATSVEDGTLERVKSHSEDEVEEGEFVVDSREAGSVTGLHHVLRPGESDSAFATIKARGDATVRERLLPLSALLRSTHTRADQFSRLGYSATSVVPMPNDTFWDGQVSSEIFATPPAFRDWHASCCGVLEL